MDGGSNRHRRGLESEIYSFSEAYRIFEQEQSCQQKILIIETGGTISCERNEEGLLVPTFGYISRFIKECNSFRYLRKYIHVESLHPIDSSNLSPHHHWQLLVDKIVQYKSTYRGIVITHGTDTLAYTSSFLTFCFNYLHVPIVLTAAQSPLSSPYSDGVNNLLGACVIALGFDPNLQEDHSLQGPRWYIPEVIVFMNHKAMLGTRIKKIDATSLDAFDAPSGDYVGVYSNTFIPEKVIVCSIVHKHFIRIIKRMIAKSRSQGSSSKHYGSNMENMDSLYYNNTHSIEYFIRSIALHDPPVNFQYTNPIVMNAAAVVKLFPCDFSSPTNHNSNTDDVKANGNDDGKEEPVWDDPVVTMIKALIAKRNVSYIILEAYGAGNGNDAIVNFVQRTSQSSSSLTSLSSTTPWGKEKVISWAIVTQCLRGYAHAVYGTAFRPNDHVAICSNMTTECAFGKVINWVNLQHSDNQPHVTFAQYMETAHHHEFDDPREV